MTFRDSVFHWIYRLLPRRINLWLHARNSRKRASILGSAARAILTQGYNGRLLVDARDDIIGRELARHGEYEKSRIEFLLRVLRPDWRVLIVGTHVGSLLVPLARHAAWVTGIEPNPDTFELLQANVLLNGLTNVTLENWAAGDRAATVPMLLNTHNSGASKVARGNFESSEFTYDHPRRVDVEMRAVDATLRGTRFHMVVIDAEGSEPEVMRGMPEILANADLLQLEIATLHLKHLNKIHARDLVAPLQGLFDYAIVDETSFHPVPRGGFAELADKLESRQGHSDVVFFKAGLLDRVRSAIQS